MGMTMTEKILARAAGVESCRAGELLMCKLDLVLVRSVPRWRIPFYLPGLMLGKILGFRISAHRLAEHVSLEGKQLRVNVDGEIFPMDRVDFGIRPGVLKLLSDS